jgi:hypothetical protein
MRHLYILLPVLVAGCGSTFSAEGSDAAPAKEAAADAAMSCLIIVPASCPDCVTENPSDQPACETYLMCFRMNQCNPADPCAQGNGICGVNTIGGGSAPLAAATATYDCACSVSADP